MIFLVASVVVLAGLVVALVLGFAGRVSVPLARATSTAGGSLLPAGPLTGEDARSLRFDTGFRGYRTDEVDAAMDALATRITELEDALSGRASGEGVEHRDRVSEPVRGPWAAPTAATRDVGDAEPSAYRRPSDVSTSWRPDAG